MTIPALPDVLLRPLVESTLTEDLGRAGDITSAAIIPPDQQGELYMVARQAGVIAGLDLARLAFTALDPQTEFEVLRPDGSAVTAGTAIARIQGQVLAQLSAERTALNFVCHLSGIATATADLVQRVQPHACRITCTRKTTPTLRAIEKYAVRVGGGMNHRFGLDDAVLIKDNHIAIAGSLELAVQRARAAIGQLVKIQVEVDTLEQLDQALALGVDLVLLDNMDLDTLRQAVQRIDGRALSEASGGITPDTIAAVAATGVDSIAVGWITHSAPILDVGLDVLS